MTDPGVVTVAVAVGGVVLAAALLGIFTRPSGFLAAVWPVNALLVGLFIRRPQLAAPAGWIGALLGYLAADLLTGRQLTDTLRLTSINLVEVLVAWMLLSRQRRADQQLRTPLSVLYLFAICAIAAITAATLANLLQLAQTGAFTWRRWLIWFVSEIASLAVILPVVLTSPPVSSWRLRFHWPALAAGLRHALPLLALLLSAFVGLLFGGPGALAFPIPALLWCALHYNLFATALLTMVFSIGEIIAVSSGVLELGGLGRTQDHMLSIRLGVTFMALGPLTVATIHAVRNELVRSLSHAASHDFLTGALSRGAFELGAREALARAAASGRSAALVMVDVDHFKQINDRHGHAAGDQILQTFAATAHHTLREGDLFGRFGGDEFAILLPETNRSEAMEVVERLRTSVQEAPTPVEDGGMVSVTLSIGVADTDGGSTALEPLMRAADKALYSAKRGGRNQTSFSALEAEVG